MPANERGSVSWVCTVHIVSQLFSCLQNFKIRIDVYILLCIKQINNENPLCSLGNSTDLKQENNTTKSKRERRSPCSGPGEGRQWPGPTSSPHTQGTAEAPGGL